MALSTTKGWIRKTRAVKGRVRLFHTIDESSLFPEKIWKKNHIFTFRLESTSKLVKTLWGMVNLLAFWKMEFAIHNNFRSCIECTFTTPLLDFVWWEEAVHKQFWENTPPVSWNQLKEIVGICYYYYHYYCYYYYILFIYFFGLCVCLFVLRIRKFRNTIFLFFLTCFLFHIRDGLVMT